MHETGGESSSSTLCEMIGNHPVGKVKNGVCGVCLATAITLTTHQIVREGHIPPPCPNCYGRNTRMCDVPWNGVEHSGVQCLTCGCQWIESLQIRNDQ